MRLPGSVVNQSICFRKLFARTICLFSPLDEIFGNSTQTSCGIYCVNPFSDMGFFHRIRISFLLERVVNLEMQEGGGRMSHWVS